LTGREPKNRGLFGVELRLWQNSKLAGCAGQPLARQWRENLRRKGRGRDGLATAASAAQADGDTALADLQTSVNSNIAAMNGSVGHKVTDRHTAVAAIPNSKKDA
jgi:hypothetical protein